ncbi:MAG TPA: hypothetical protein DCM02_06710 [Flavobacterium sp.]|nr:hypothetical protein [Flavobacterium sp.]HAT81074.1 hypothetical protein [Flavobacterium sp.]
MTMQIAIAPEYGVNYKKGYIGFAYEADDIESIGIAYFTAFFSMSQIKVSHVFIVKNEDECIEVTREKGVKDTSIKEYFDNPRCQIVFREPIGLSDEIADRIVTVAEKHKGDSYDYALFFSLATLNNPIGWLANRITQERLQKIITQDHENDKRWICSEFVAYCLDQQKEYCDKGVLKKPHVMVYPQNLFEDNEIFKKWEEMPPKLSKVQFSQKSGFNPNSAMELANLIVVANSDYEVWDQIKNHKNQLDSDLTPAIITGSTVFVDLPVNEIDSIEVTTETKSSKNYQQLDQYWRKTGKVEKYDRLHSFWFPEIWLGELLNFSKLREFINTNIPKRSSAIENIENLVINEQLFGFIARSKTDQNKFFVVFRGTREGAEWLDNLRMNPKPFLPELKQRLGQVRNGFNLIYSKERQNGSFTKPTIQKTVEEFFEKSSINDSSEIYITGHSLGAALATLATLHIQKLAEEKKIKPKIQLYTLASPRVGDEIFAKHFEDIECFRVINSEDMIQAVPFPTTQLLDDEIVNGMKDSSKKAVFALRSLLEIFTGGLSKYHYQHIGFPITFTKQTGTIAGNHNLTKIYREALNIPHYIP